MLNSRVARGGWRISVLRGQVTFVPTPRSSDGVLMGRRTKE